MASTESERQPWPARLHGKRATIRTAYGDVYRGTLRRTRVGWRMGDPVNGPGAAWYDEAMMMVDLEAPMRCPTTDKPARSFPDVERVEELDHA